MSIALRDVYDSNIRLHGFGSQGRPLCMLQYAARITNQYSYYLYALVEGKSTMISTYFIRYKSEVQDVLLWNSRKQPDNTYAPLDKLHILVLKIMYIYLMFFKIFAQMVL